MANEDEAKVPTNLAIKIGIAGAIGFGALATGLFVSRRGRHLMREAWQGRRRTTLEDRVLDRLWGDARLGRRRIDVDEVARGTIALSGWVRDEQERRRALSMAAQCRGVEAVLDQLELDPDLRHAPRGAQLAEQIRRGATELTGGRRGRREARR